VNDVHTQYAILARQGIDDDLADGRAVCVID
jgi:hypothetical protein